MGNNAKYNPDHDHDAPPFIGSPTEVAILLASLKARMGPDYWAKSGFERLNEATFDSTRKRMSVIYKNAADQLVVTTKGAPEKTINLCTKILWNGKIVDLNEDILAQVEKKNAAMASLGLRVLGMAYKEVPLSSASKSDIHETPENLEKDLIFCGLIGIIDPPRKEVKNAITVLRAAGIKVIMITGDHHRTASAIAVKLGILPEGSEEAMIGTELENLKKDELSQKDPFPRVFARVTPKHKQKIVSALRKRGEVTAMTGDGVNDAPAIKFADVGIAMNLTGTDLTKEAADILLMDDNFANIPEAVREGRRTYDNILKFVFYLLACNSSEIYVVLISVIVGFPPPFTPVMILWANLVADVPPALALGIDPPEEGILSRKPRDPSIGIFTWKSALILLFNGLSLAGVTLAQYAIALGPEDYNRNLPADFEYFHSPTHAGALAFVQLVMLHIVHAFVARSPIHTTITPYAFDNPWLIGGCALSLVLTTIACYIPVVNVALNQWPLNAWDWGKILIGIIVHLFLTEIVKAIARGARKHHDTKRVGEREKLFYADL